MGAGEIAAGETSIIFFEPDGLLLLMYLRQIADDRYANALVLQMTYLGVGQIAVDIVLVASGGAREGSCRDPIVSRGDAVLRGPVDGRRPLVWTKEVVMSGDMELHWIVRGQSGPGRPLRGELRSTVTGRPSRIAVETFAGATRE